MDHPRNVVVEVVPENVVRMIYVCRQVVRGEDGVVLVLKTALNDIDTRMELGLFDE
jgi:hypothetical protein